MLKRDYLQESSEKRRGQIIEPGGPATGNSSSAPEYNMRNIKKKTKY